VAASRPLLAASGKSLTEEAWILLGEKTGFDIRNGMAALEKLIVYAGPRTEIDERDVAALVGKTREDTVFNLTNALAERDLPACLTVLDELLVRGTPPLMILSMIAREIRLLLQARLLILQGDLEGFDARMPYPAFQSRILPQVKTVSARVGDGIYTLDIAGLHPFVQYNVFRHAVRFSCDTLAACLEALARADVLMKTSGRNPRLLLERILLQATERQAS
jgi:DNA polymerase-3 subunit delta